VASNLKTLVGDIIFFTFLFPKLFSKIPQRLYLFKISGRVSKISFPSLGKPFRQNLANFGGAKGTKENL